MLGVFDRSLTLPARDFAKSMRKDLSEQDNRQLDFCRIAKMHAPQIAY